MRFPQLDGHCWPMLASFVTLGSSERLPRSPKLVGTRRQALQMFSKVAWPDSITLPFEASGEVLEGAVPCNGSWADPSWEIGASRAPGLLGVAKRTENMHLSAGWHEPMDPFKRLTLNKRPTQPLTSLLGIKWLRSPSRMKQMILTEIKASCLLANRHESWPLWPCKFNQQYGGQSCLCMFMPAGGKPRQ